ncbi:hypothetical protein [Massilia cavernae]|uniref:Uncharacterized protein n=1 Tax=Massilia cavernae TaxID=2320864 RepID=A0A418XSX7_9BURK|nr:hypothetical protein [Massilia cavernae]RJG15649.1 hypothetical protein D3872_12615 [Massilia cavernae]
MKKIDLHIPTHATSATVLSFSFASVKDYGVDAYPAFMPRHTNHDVLQTVNSTGRFKLRCIPVFPGIRDQSARKAFAIDH